MNRPLLAVVLLSAVTLSACSSVAVLQEQAGKVLLPQLAIGACTNLEFPEEQATGEVTDIPTVDCAGPHKWEAYAEQQLAEGDYPGDEEIVCLAEEFCYGEFETFIGTNYDESELDMTYLSPTGDGWTQLHDRTVTCLAGTEAGDVTGSLKGAQR